jgi:hypothetical protein
MLFDNSGNLDFQEIYKGSTYFQHKFVKKTYKVIISYNWYSFKACEICRSLVQKKKYEKKLFFITIIVQTAIVQFWVSIIFRS